MTKAENSNISIVVVDDESIVLSLIRDALEEDEYQLETALSAEEALKIIESKKIDLIISDIRMPRINGIQLVKQARELYPEVGVIFMTGYANLNSAKDAIKQGASDYILKPFELSEIRQAVSKAVEQIKRGAREKQSSSQLEKLSDLSQMLFSAGDRKSLTISSLKFALMHCSSNCGCVLHWDSAQTEFSLVAVADNQMSEIPLDEHLMRATLDNMNLAQLQEPQVISSLDEHPLCIGSPDPRLIELMRQYWSAPDEQIVVVPVSRQYSIYGFLMISAPEDTPSASQASLKFLSIAANQLAMSLENLDLLEETQKAYSRLKELQDETIQLEKMATRGEMSAEIGHELNNFLGVVSGNLSLLDFQLKKGSVGELEKYVCVMTDTIEKMKKFTSNLMDLSPISTRKEIIRFDRLITEVIDYLRPQRRFDGVEIEVEVADSELLFEADTVHIQQVLYNMFNNAADATSDCETRKIRVSVDPHFADGQFRVAITDSGAGITPEFLNKVFKEKFTTKEKGHGFGLLVCKRIMDSHNGTLSVESTPGHGTTFYLDFPTTDKLVPETILA